jgi:hypothetical protein
MSTDAPHRITLPAILTNGLLVEITIQERSLPRRISHRYGSYWAVSPREYEKATRVYIAEKGETILDNLESRTGRPVDTYRAAVKEVLTAIGLGDHKVTWSQKAGCSMCPCSPGFILKTPEGKGFRYQPEGGPCDIWVEISAGDLGESARRDINVIA